MKRSTTELKTLLKSFEYTKKFIFMQNEHGHLGRWPVQLGIASDPELMVLKLLLDEVSKRGEVVETGICQLERLQEDAFYRTKDVR